MHLLPVRETDTVVIGEAVKPLNLGLSPLPETVANDNPGGDCYWAGGQPKLNLFCKWDITHILYWISQHCGT